MNNDKQNSATIITEVENWITIIIIPLMLVGY